MKKKREEARRSVRVARDTTRLELQGSKDVGTCRDLQSRNYGYTIDNDTAQTRARARALCSNHYLWLGPPRNREIYDRVRVIVTVTTEIGNTWRTITALTERMVFLLIRQT